MSAQVYWIRAAHHSDLMSEGYIGVSKNATNRWVYGHKWAHTRGRHENPRLSNAITKHGWENLVKTVLVVADESYCYELESKLRPSEKIGWNLATGGCKPPVSKLRGPDYVSPLKGVPRPTPWLVGSVPPNKGKSPSDESRAKMSLAGKGRKQTPEQIAKRVASRRATLEAQGRTV
jgi:hypothetical protein